jgi:hypothetical protein
MKAQYQLRGQSRPLEADITSRTAISPNTAKARGLGKRNDSGCGLHTPNQNGNPSPGPSVSSSSWCDGQACTFPWSQEYSSRLQQGQGEPGIGQDLGPLPFSPSARHMTGAENSVRQGRCSSGPGWRNRRGESPCCRAWNLESLFQQAPEASRTWTSKAGWPGED